MRWKVYLGIILFLALLAGCEQQQYIYNTYYPVQPEPLPRFHKLNNGLTAVILSNNHSTAVSFYALVRAGSKYEDNQSRGLAHSLEHMSFKRTQHDHDMFFSEYFNSMGVPEINAFTTKDYVIYYFTTIPENFDPAFQEFVNIITDPYFSKDDFETEKQVIYQEYLTDLDNRFYPSAVRYDKLVYGDHPYSYPTIGDPNIFLKLNVSDLKKYYDKYYTPDRITIAVLGDLPEDKALDMIRKGFGKLVGNNAQSVPDIKPLTEDVVKRESLNISEPNTTSEERSIKEIVRVGFPIPSLTVKERLELELISKELLNKMTAFEKDLKLNDLEQDNTLNLVFIINKSDEDELLENLRIALGIITDSGIEDLETKKQDLFREENPEYISDEAKKLIMDVVKYKVSDQNSLDHVWNTKEIIDNISEDDIKHFASTYLNHKILFITEVDDEE